jgi:orotidine-5'-phosphate decarboxylase
LKTEIILALDVDSTDKAKRFVNKLYPKVRIFKVGLQLFSAAGPAIINFINQKGGSVFLDLKFFDIPNTVANAVREAVRLKVKMLTLHISGGEAMLEAAQEAAKKEAAALGIKKPLLIGVTVLTSVNKTKATAGDVLKKARLAKDAGIDGVVCSVQEAAAVRKACGNNFIIVTPGIRPKGAASGDQKRVATAKDAVVAGADYIVVGRPILEAGDPLQAAAGLIKEI